MPQKEDEQLIKRLRAEYVKATQAVDEARSALREAEQRRDVAKTALDVALGKSG
jgi:hypothetical protein